MCIRDRDHTHLFHNATRSTNNQSRCITAPARAAREIHRASSPHLQTPQRQIAMLGEANLTSPSKRICPTPTWNGFRLARCFARGSHWQPTQASTSVIPSIFHPIFHTLLSSVLWPVPQNNSQADPRGSPRHGHPAYRHLSGIQSWRSVLMAVLRHGDPAHRCLSGILAEPL